MQRDSVSFTFTVATVLCVVCSLMVAGTAEGLRSGIKTNKELDRKKNILIAADLAGSDTGPDEVDRVYQENIEEVMVDLSTGEPASEGELPDGYDPAKAAKDPELQVEVLGDGLMGIRHREPYAPIYKLGSGGYVLPIYGKGLWGTLYGFLAMESDGMTVKGITFYEHKETPGLGAEVENPNWQSQWPGKKAYAPDGAVQLAVKKGQTPADTPAADYTIDGLSGATITTKGVDHMISYWLGPEGFGKYLANQHGSDHASSEHPSNGADPEHG